MSALLTGPQLNGRTFRENFCADAGCQRDDFEPIIFWHCLRPRARVFVWLAGGARSGCFVRDRELITRVGDATNIEEIRRALRDYQRNPANYTWPRRILGARISTERLRWLASHYVPFGVKMID